MTDPIGSAARAAARRITRGRRGGAVGAARNFYERLGAPVGRAAPTRGEPEAAVAEAEVARLRAELSAELGRLAERSR